MVSCFAWGEQRTSRMPSSGILGEPGCDQDVRCQPSAGVQSRCASLTTRGCHHRVPQRHPNRRLLTDRRPCSQSTESGTCLPTVKPFPTHTTGRSSSKFQTLKYGLLKHPLCSLVCLCFMHKLVATKQQLYVCMLKNAPDKWP